MEAHVFQSIDRALISVKMMDGDTKNIEGTLRRTSVACSSLLWASKWT